MISEIIRSHVFQSLTPGPKLLVLGAVHGNEKCGTVAIQQVITELQEGKLSLKKGQVTFVPVCNPAAYAANVRQTERNLNRYLVPMADPDCYEARIGNVLCPMLAQCDVLLDIHSYTVGGAPFALAKDFEAVEDCNFAAALNIDVLLTGWAAAYATTGKRVAQNPEEGTGTTQYAKRNGAVVATLECGQHDDLSSITVAYEAILRALKYLNMIEADLSAPRSPRRVKMFQVFYRPEGGELTANWKNFERVKQGEQVATVPNGDIYADRDCVVIMPKASAATGEEWFYLGEEV